MSSVKKINVAVIMGGQSSEHEVSLSSGLSVVRTLDTKKYNLKIIKIEKNGAWLVQPGYFQEPPEQGGALLAKTLDGLAPISPNLGLEQALKDGVEVALLALHGKYGEDGSIQGLLQMAGLSYTGSGILASALAMDKQKSNEVYAFHGLKVPKYFVIEEHDYKEPAAVIERVASELGFPCVLKPSDGGSSVGTYIVKEKAELAGRITEDFKLSRRLMLQEFINGQELTCAVLDTNEGSIALPPTLIKAKLGEFYDYKAKYAAGGSEHLVPAPLAPEKLEELKNIALTAHKILGCSGLTRTDVMLKDSQFYILETNTIPGMTPTSLAPEAASTAGISFAELLDQLINQAIRLER